MTVLIDLGTSRTAVAATNALDNWIDIEVPRPNPGLPNANWTELELLIRAVAGIEVINGDVPHLRNYSRYYQIGDLVVPASISGSAVKAPAGATLFPDPKTATFSIKQDAAQAGRFLRAIRRLVGPVLGEAGQWVIGRSSGGIDPTVLGLPGGTQTFNEATAVMFAALSGRIFEVGPDAKFDFAVVADLGGGFLDVAVADEIVYSKSATSARIVSYGGYPLGVDRVAERFDDGEIAGGETLATLLRLPIELHLADYLAGAGASHRRGAIIFTGGGFRRLEKNVNRRRLQQMLTDGLSSSDLDVIWPPEDTKELTLSGLRLLSSRGKVNYRDTGRDLSAENPHFHGQDTLKAAGYDPGAAITWSGLIDDLRRSSFRTNV